MVSLHLRGESRRRGGRFEYPIPGIAGGGTPRKGKMALNGQPLRAGQQVLLDPGDSVTFRTPGGDGSGLAQNRNRTMVHYGLLDGYICAAAAEDAYGYAPELGTEKDHDSA